MAKKNEIVKVENVAVIKGEIHPTSIESLIRIVRDKQIILDRDLAQLYGVDVAQLNRQVKRNIDRFPEDFMFQLTKEEYEDLKCQIGISSWGGDRFLPHAFTEQGIAMLSGILRSPIAISTNIQIMRAFVAMRHLMASTMQILQRMASIERHQIETDKRIEEVFKRLDDGTVKPKQGVFYDGEVFDAYKFITEKIKEAKMRIVLFDNYIDESVLNMLDKRASSVDVVVYTKTIDSHLQTDIARHDAQYPHIDVQVFTKTHDRFLCIDDTVYHIGASLKDLGKKWFAFNLMEITTDDLLTRM